MIAVAQKILMGAGFRWRDTCLENIAICWLGDQVAVPRRCSTLSMTSFPLSRMHSTNVHCICWVVHCLADFSSSESKIYIFVCCLLSQEQHSALRLLAEKEVVPQAEQKSFLL
jgi:hypothetical protein